MPTITFNCPNCGCAVTVGAEYAGKSGKCQQCGGGMTVPFSDASLGPDLMRPFTPGSDADIDAALGGLATVDNKQAMIAAMAGKTELGRGGAPVYGAATGAVRDGGKGSFMRKLPRLFVFLAVVGGTGALVYFKPDFLTGLLQAVRGMAGL